MAPDLDLRDRPRQYTRGPRTAANAPDVNLKVISEIDALAAHS
jgi:hypothetical protein